MLLEIKSILLPRACLSVFSWDYDLLPTLFRPYSFNNLQLDLYYLLTKIDLKWEELFRPLE